MQFIGKVGYRSSVVGAISESRSSGIRASEFRVGHRSLESGIGVWSRASEFRVGNRSSLLPGDESVFLFFAISSFGIEKKV